MRALFLFLIGGLMLGPVAATERYRASPWVRTSGAEVRLILPDSGGAATAPLWGGIDIRLLPGSKTYWRTPGETGVAPAADFAASRGIKSAALAFPLPVAFDDGGGGTAIGYTSDLILPFRLEPEGDATRVAVTVNFEFGICQKNLCLPAQALLKLAAGEGAADPALTGRMAETLALVPKPSPLGTAGEPGIQSVRARQQGQELVVEVAARVAPDDPAPSLFVEGDDVFAVTLDRARDGAAQFSARSRRDAAQQGKPLALRLTLGSKTSAIETDVTLDVGALPP